MPPLDYSPVPEPWHEPEEPRAGIPWGALAFAAVLAAVAIVAWAGAA